MTIANSEQIMQSEIRSLAKTSLREKKRVDFQEKAFHALFLTSAVIGIVSLAVIAYFIIRESIPAFQEAGISGIVLAQDWLPPALYGVATMIVASLVSTLGAVLVGVPVGAVSQSMSWSFSWMASPSVFQSASQMGSETNIYFFQRQR